MKYINLRLSKFSRWAIRNPILSGVIAGLLSWLFMQIVAGLIQNSAYDYFKDVLIPWMRIDVQAKNSVFFLLGIGCLFLGVIVGFIIGYLRTRHPINFDNKKIAELNIQSVMLRWQKLLSHFQMIMEINLCIQAGLVEKTESNLNHSIDNYFLIIFKHIGTEVVNGGGIMLPDPSDPDCLSFWRMSPDQVMSPKRFYIGSNKNIKSECFQRGMAGSVFLDGRPRIVNIIDRHTGEADNPDFVNFGLNIMGQTRPVIPYSSGICLPVHWNNKVVAVVSIESQEKDTFDEESKERLQPIADQLGTILFYHSKISLPT